MKILIIIGSDVYARRVIKCIEALIKSGEEISIKCILDNNEEKNDVKGYKILDKIDNANLYNDEDTSFIIAIKNNKTRQEIADKFQEFDYYTVIHPTITNRRSDTPQQHIPKDSELVTSEADLSRVTGAVPEVTESCRLRTEKGTMQYAIFLSEQAAKGAKRVRVK